MTSQKLPDRALFAFYEHLPLYNTQQLREIANTYGISKRKKQFYEHCDRASIGYHRDRMLEHDFYHLHDAISTNQKALASARNFADTLEIYNDLCPAYSWYGEMCYKHRCFVDTVELHSLVVVFINSMKIVIENLPSVPNSRRPRLALRKWANLHMDYWEAELRQRITIPNDRKDGMSRCHRFLHDLLDPIDPEAVEHLPTIIRERRSAQKKRTETAAS